MNSLECLEHVSSFKNGAVAEYVVIWGSHAQAFFCICRLEPEDHLLWCCNAGWNQKAGLDLEDSKDSKLKSGRQVTTIFGCALVPWQSEDYA